MVPELLEVSELEETNLSSRSFMSGSPSLRAPQKRHFFMELKTSGSSISSESFESSDGSETKELVPVTLGSPGYGQGPLGPADIRSATRLPPQPPGPPGVPLRI